MATASDPQDFIRHFSSAMLDRIGHLTVPDVPEHELAAFLQELRACWSEVAARGIVQLSGPDQQVRKIGVSLQGVAEEVLASGLEGRVRSSEGIILTPVPATPLCISRDGSGVEGVVTPEIEADPLRRFTVVLRARTTRDYLGSRIGLCVAYPKDGIRRRSQQQRDTYYRELADHAPYLTDRPLDCAGVPDRLVGAVYVVTDRGGEEFAFGIKMSQANAAPEVWQYALAFGAMDHQGIRAWVEEVKEFVREHSEGTRAS